MSHETDQLSFVELGPVSLRDWARLIGHEPDPFGEAAGALEYRPKERNVGVRDGDGRLIAAGGLTEVSVTVDDRVRFDLAGIGGLITHQDARGRGLGNVVMTRLEQIAAETGWDRVMGTCQSDRISFYERRHWQLLDGAVSVDQPDGPVEVDMVAMWLPLREGVTWPAEGPIHLHGLPF